MANSELKRERLTTGSDTHFKLFISKPGIIARLAEDTGDTGSKSYSSYSSSYSGDTRRKRKKRKLIIGIGAMTILIILNIIIGFLIVKL